MISFIEMIFGRLVVSQLHFFQHSKWYANICIFYGISLQMQWCFPAAGGDNKKQQQREKKKLKWKFQWSEVTNSHWSEKKENTYLKLNLF